MNNRSTPHHRNLFPLTALFWGLVIAVAGLRLYYCFQLTPYTTDLLRNLGYGKAFSHFGFSLYDMTPFDLSPWPSQFLWPNHHYTYPPATLLLFGLIGGISTSMAFAKIVLTGFDALASWFIWKTSGDRWTALLYWINPISIWYTSREGQFEGFVVFWTVLAIGALRRNKSYAYGLLGIAVQTKFFPGFLGPWFLQKMSWRNPRKLLAEIGWGMISFLPSVLAFYYGGYPEHLLEKNYVPTTNPLSWGISDAIKYTEYPWQALLAHWGLSVLFLLLCLWGIKKTQKAGPWIAPMLFVLLVRSGKLGQFWYFILLPALCLPIEEKGWRRFFFAYCISFGLLDIYSIFIGPIGYHNPKDVMDLIRLAFGGF